MTRSTRSRERWQERPGRCLGIDGPEHLHDKQRKLVVSSDFNVAVKWIDRINKA